LELDGWGSLKQDLINASGLSKDALHVYLGVLLLVAFAIFLRRRLHDPLVWLCVCAAVALNELTDYLHYLNSDPRYVTYTISDSLIDAFNSLAIPALVCLFKLDVRLPVRTSPPPSSRRLNLSEDEPDDSRSRGRSRSRNDSRAHRASY
jgi:hypothetical protein